MSKINLPPFKFVGSKWSLMDEYKPHLDKIIEYIDQINDIFCGSTAFSYWMSQTYYIENVHLNDNNAELIQTYQYIKANREQFLKELKQHWGIWLSKTKPERKEYYYKLRDANTIQTDPVPLFFMMCVNFNGLWQSYEKCGFKYSTAPGGCTESAITAKRKLEQADKWSQWLEKCTITFGDYSNITPTKFSLTYSDPPYLNTEIKYRHPFTTDNLKQLLEYHRTPRTGLHLHSNQWQTPEEKALFDTEMPSPRFTRYSFSKKHTGGRGVKNKTRTVKNEIICYNWK